MIQTQLAEALKKFDPEYKENILLDLAKITMIFTDHDVRIYTDPKSMRFYFDADAEMLKIWRGKIVGGEFVSYGTTPTSYIPYSAIGGFIQTSKIGYNGMIMYR